MSLIRRLGDHAVHLLLAGDVGCEGNDAGAPALIASWGTNNPRVRGTLTGLKTQTVHPQKPGNSTPRGKIMSTIWINWLIAHPAQWLHPMIEFV